MTWWIPIVFIKCVLFGEPGRTWTRCFSVYILKSDKINGKLLSFLDNWCWEYRWIAKLEHFNIVWRFRCPWLYALQVHFKSIYVDMIYEYAIWAWKRWNRSFTDHSNVARIICIPGTGNECRFQWLKTRDLALGSVVFLYCLLLIAKKFQWYLITL